MLFKSVKSVLEKFGYEHIWHMENMMAEFKVGPKVLRVKTDLRMRDVVDISIEYPKGSFCDLAIQLRDTLQATLNSYLTIKVANNRHELMVQRYWRWNQLSYQFMIDMGPNCFTDNGDKTLIELAKGLIDNREPPDYLVDYLLDTRPEFRKVWES